MREQGRERKRSGRAGQSRGGVWRPCARPMAHCNGPWFGLGIRAPCTGSALVVCNGLPPKTALGVLALARLHVG